MWILASGSSLGRERCVWRHNASYMVISTMREANKLLWRLVLERIFIPPWRFSRWPLNRVWYLETVEGIGKFGSQMEEDPAEESRNRNSDCVQPSGSSWNFHNIYRNSQEVRKLGLSNSQICCVHSVVSNSLWSHNPPGSSDHGIFQARILECAAILFSRGPSRPRDLTCIFWVSSQWQAGSLSLVPLRNTLDLLRMSAQPPKSLKWQACPSEHWRLGLPNGCWPEVPSGRAKEVAPSWVVG